MAGCSALPQSGPSDRAVAAKATVSISTADHSTGIDYVLVDLTRNVLKSIPRSVETFESFGGGHGGAPDFVLGVGDVIDVTIFESDTGGLFVPKDAASRPGNYVTLPHQTIDRSGVIAVPYAGDIQVIGRTIAQIQRQIVERLQNRAIEPQVIVSVVERRSSEVSVLGDVNAPSKLQLNTAGERVLDVISRAGGLKTPALETYVTLQRRGRQGTMLFDRLVRTPAENIYVVPGDVIYVNRERRTFLAFGATGLNGRFDFDETNLSLGEALGKSGGLLDERANPSQVLVYRLVERETAGSFGIGAADLARFPGRSIPIIFKANLKDPAAFFATQGFQMRDKDILYVTNSDSVQILKFLNLVNASSSTYAGVAIDARNAARAVGAAN